MFNDLGVYILFSTLFGIVVGTAVSDRAKNYRLAWRVLASVLVTAVCWAFAHRIINLMFSLTPRQNVVAVTIVACFGALIGAGLYSPDKR